MLETEAEFEALQQLLDESIRGAGPFIRESLEMPQKSLSAPQLLTYWDGLLTAGLLTRPQAASPVLLQPVSCWFTGDSLSPRSPPPPAQGLSRAALR